jgi:8-oxo-dGTP pyrophosphatase MutT (NUDIX family)
MITQMAAATTTTTATTPTKAPQSEGPSRGVVELADATDEALREVLCRFVVNVPTLELSSTNRLMYHLERAWWFVLDHVLKHPMSAALADDTAAFAEFVQRAFQLLKINPASRSVQDVCREYKSYKQRIPVAGCVLLRENASTKDWEVLMVQPTNAPCWTFPKGKRNQKEKLVDTALRELTEETGVVVDAARVRTACVAYKLPGIRPPTTLFVCRNPSITKDVVCRPSHEVQGARWISLKNIHRSRVRPPEDCGGSGFERIQLAAMARAAFLVIPDLASGGMSARQSGRSARSSYYGNDFALIVANHSACDSKVAAGAGGTGTPLRATDPGGRRAAPPLVAR